MFQARGPVSRSQAESYCGNPYVQLVSDESSVDWAPLTPTVDSGVTTEVHLARI